MPSHSSRAWLYIAVFQNSQRIRIEVQRTIFVVYALLLIHNVLIQSYFCWYRCAWCSYPVDRSFYLASGKAAAALGLRVIGTVNFRHIAVLILLQSYRILQSMHPSGALHCPGTDGNTSSAVLP